MLKRDAGQGRKQNRERETRKEEDAEGGMNDKYEVSSILEASELKKIGAQLFIKTKKNARPRVVTKNPNFWIYALKVTYCVVVIKCLHFLLVGVVATKALQYLLCRPKKMLERKPKH